MQLPAVDEGQGRSRAQVVQVTLGGRQIQSHHRLVSVDASAVSLSKQRIPRIADHSARVPGCYPEPVPDGASEMPQRKGFHSKLQSELVVRGGRPGGRRADPRRPPGVSTVDREDARILLLPEQRHRSRRCLWLEAPVAVRVLPIACVRDRLCFGIALSHVRAVREEQARCSDQGERQTFRKPRPGRGRGRPRPSARHGLRRRQVKPLPLRSSPLGPHLHSSSARFG